MHKLNLSIVLLFSLMYTPALNMLNTHSVYIRLTANIMKYLTKCADLHAFMYHELFM
jgi:hypothetical protein